MSEIKDYLKEHNTSYRDIATKTGYGYTYVWDLLNGKRRAGYRVYERLVKAAPEIKPLLSLPARAKPAATKKREVASRIKRYFKEHGLAIKDAARIAGYSSSTFFNLLNNDKEIGSKTYRRLTKAFPDIAPLLEVIRKPRTSRFDFLKQTVEALKTSPVDTCVEWPFTCNSFDGYGRLRIGSRRVMAHRTAFEVYHGKPADGFVCHTCDNPKCFNPAHLYQGTHADNVKDYVMRGPSEFALKRRNGGPGPGRPRKAGNGKH